MTGDEWAQAHDPLEMVGLVRQPPPHATRAQQLLHSSRLLCYLWTCLRAFGAGDDANLVTRWFGGGLSPEEAAVRRLVLLARSRRTAGGSYSSGRRPRRVPLDARRASAVLAALADSPWEAAVAVTLETQHHLQREQCGWLRCLFPSPLRHVAFDPAWRTPTVMILARQMDEGREFSVMPILADALQDAGCDSEELLGHCRGSSPHIPGCWVVAFVLGKGVGTPD